MRVFIIRHGETDWNIGKKIQGSSDIPINETGRQQAEKIANRLRLEKIDFIISSPLKRAKETTQIIKKFHPDTPVIYEKELREVCFGDMEGLTFQEYLDKYAPDFHKLTPQEEFNYKHPHGESLKERVEKLIPLVKTWKQKYKNKTILLSTHGYIKKGILVAFGVKTFPDLSHIEFTNTALTVLKPFDLEQIELLNDTAHLYE
jgi:broad specificity phosphatase PhoE